MSFRHTFWFSCWVCGKTQLHSINLYSQFLWYFFFVDGEVGLFDVKSWEGDVTEILNI